MSTSVVTKGGASPFDIPAIQRSITAAMATLPKDRWGQLVVDAGRDKASAALMVRAGQHVEFLAWVTKPYVGNLDYGLQGRVSFLVGPEPRPVLGYRYRGWYRLFRLEYEGKPLNGRLSSAWKALLSRFGYSVSLIG
jgi:hypothetical protein